MIKTFIILIYLGTNLYLHLNLHYNNIFYLGILSILLLCILSILYQKVLKLLLFFFGISFIFYGFQSFSINNHFFEFSLNFISLTLLFINLREGFAGKTNRVVTTLLLLYCVMSLLSLFQLPVSYIFRNYLLLGMKNFSNALFRSNTLSYMYSFAAVNRLILFFVFVYLLSNLLDSKRIYEVLFKAVSIGAILSAFIGILDYYSAINLEWFRLLDPDANPGGLYVRLQSTFGHPTWFAEFVTIALPFFLIYYLRTKRLSINIILLTLMVIAGTSLMLSKTRAGWICFLPTLIFAGCFYNIATDGSQTKTERLRGLFFYIIAVCLSIFLAIFLLGERGISAHQNTKRLDVTEQDYPLLDKTVKRGEINYTLTHFLESSRFDTWMHGINVGREHPLFGMGYETFRWHISILKGVPESFFRKGKSFKKIGAIIDTPHNLFLQVFVSTGLVGLSLWITITIYCLLLLFNEFRISRNYFNIIVMLSIIIFHIYGVFQSLQYIPVVFFLVFLNYGYVLSINKENEKKIWPFITKIYLIITIIALFVYISNSGFKDLINKYKLVVYAPNRYGYNYIGFYPLEYWNIGRYRWTKSEGIIYIPHEGTVELTFRISHPDFEKIPVILDIIINENQFDRINFTTLRNGVITKRYIITKPTKLHLKISRTWNPYKYRVSNDNRDLGVAVSEIKYIN